MLSSEQYADIEAKFDNPDPSPSSSSASPDVKKETTSSKQQDVKPAAAPTTDPVKEKEGEQQVKDAPLPDSQRDDSPSGDDGKSGKATPSSIPYDRFKEAISAKNDAKTRIKELEALVAEMKQSPAPTPVVEQKTDTQTSWLDQILSGSDAPEAEAQAEANPYESRISGMEAKFQAYEKSEMTMTLTNEIDALVVKYPGVPASALWKAVAEDGSADLSHTAEQIALFVSGVEDRAITRHRESSSAEVQRKVAPRPSGTSGARTTSSPSASSDGPRTIKDSRATAMEILRKAGFRR